jgi:hypothetical protein
MEHRKLLEGLGNRYVLHSGWMMLLDSVIWRNFQEGNQ